MLGKSKDDHFLSPKKAKDEEGDLEKHLKNIFTVKRRRRRGR